MVQYFLRLFLLHTYTQNSLHFNSPFLPLALLLLYIYIYIYIYLPIAFHVISCQIYTNQKRCHLPLIFRWHLPSSNIIVSSNPILYELTTTKKRDLHFILRDGGNNDFDVKVECCGLVDFIKDVIDCVCLTCVFYFRIKEKKKDIFYINFYSTIFF